MVHWIHFSWKLLFNYKLLLANTRLLKKETYVLLYCFSFVLFCFIFFFVFVGNFQYSNKPLGAKIRRDTWHTRKITKQHCRGELDLFLQQKGYLCLHDLYGILLFSFKDTIIFVRTKWTLERFSNDCRKTNTKAITPTNHDRGKQRDEPITIPSNYM